MFTCVAINNYSDVTVVASNLKSRFPNSTNALHEPTMEPVIPDNTCQDLRVHPSVPSAKTMLIGIIKPAADVKHNVSVNMATMKFCLEVSEGKRYQRHTCRPRWRR